MGLLKWGFIAAAAVALLPADREEQEILYNRATLAAQWTMTYCDRNAETCALAGGLWDGFKKKAQFGGRLAYDALVEQLSSTEHAVAEADPGLPSQDYAPPQRRALDGSGLETGTLRDHDLEPQWRGPHTYSTKTTGRLDASGG